MQTESLESLQTEEDMWPVRKGHFSTSFSREILGTKRMDVWDETAPITNSQVFCALVYSKVILVQDWAGRLTWMTVGIYLSSPCATNMDGHNSESKWGSVGWQSHPSQWNMRGGRRVFVQFKKCEIMSVETIPLNFCFSSYPASKIWDPELFQILHWISVTKV